MCGIFGFVVDKVNEDIITIFRNLIFYSKVRGLFATGVAYISYNKIHKKVEQRILT